MNIFETIANTGEAKGYKKGKVAKYFQHKVNSKFEVYKFRQATQHPGESMDTFYTRLHSLASNCAFTDNDKEIKSLCHQNLDKKPSEKI